MMGSIRARAALFMAASAALTGLVVGSLSVWSLRAELRDGAIEHAMLVADGIEPLAVENMLTPGSADLELAMFSRLEALRANASIRAVAVFDREGRRVPGIDTAASPAVRGTGEVFLVHGDAVLVAHPIERDGVPMGYLALELAYPRWAVIRQLVSLIAATLLVVVLAVAAAIAAASPATRNLRAIAMNIEGLGRGATWVAQPVRTGADEIGRVGHAVYDLARRLDEAAGALARPSGPALDTHGDVPVPVAPRPVDLFAVIGEAIDAAARGAEVRREIDVGGSATRTDPDLLGACVAELVGNALAHGGGAVQVAAFTDGGHLVLTVTDTGQGLPEHVAAQLFRPIATATGWSCGLALAARRARALGGSLSHDRRYRGGSRFVVRVPVLVSSSDP